MNSEVYILWDIDGTLIDTNGQGVQPFSEAIEIFLGSKIIMDRKKMAGKTDYEIIQALTELRVSKEADKFQFDQILQFYVDGLSANLVRRPVKVLGDIEKALQTLSKSNNMRVGVLSGNCQNGGIEKLKSGNLYGFFDPNLIFLASFKYFSRIKLLEHAAENYKRIVIIGDTPNDVEAAKTCKIPIISIATGLYNFSELESINKGFVLGKSWKYEELHQLIQEIYVGN